MLNVRSLSIAAVTVATLAGVGAISVLGWTPLELVAPTVSTVVAPEAVSRNLNCSGNVLASVADASTWTRIGKVATGITGGIRAGEFLTETDALGAIIAFEGTPEAVAATESVSLDNDIAAGYLAAECGDPANSQWLVGGSTQTGRDAVLTIANGSGVDARIDLEFWGANGPITAPAASGLVIAAGTAKSYSVAGFAPNESSPVVHVISNGAPVWATLQVSTVRGLTPGGLDRIVPVVEPSANVVIPIVRPPEESVIGPLRVDPDYADTVTSLRLLAPGETDGTATVTVSSFDGSDPVVIATAVAAGEVVDIAIDELAEGDFTITVDADVPILASARFSSYSDSSRITDMAWSPGIAARAGLAMSFVPVDESTLAIVNSGDTDASVDVTAAGETTTVTVSAHSSLKLLVGRGSVAVSSESPLASGVVIETRGGVATLRLPTEPLGSRSVQVIAH
jgi:hypothetical protein